MAKKISNQAADEKLFRQEMEDVVPLRATPRSDSRRPGTPVRRQSDRSAGSGAAADFHTPWAGPHIDAEDGSSHRKDGVRKRTLQKLKRGQFPLGGQLDLHHMSTKAGRAVLLEYIAEAQSMKIECVRVIHGKGLRSSQGPRLKLMTRQVLREHAAVLAYTDCKPADGGSGAVDVLLRPL